MTFDEARGEVVLFGGLGVAANAFLADTWSFDGITWTRRNPAHSPSPRKDHVLAYDPLRARIVLVGGQTTSLLVDAWEWDGQDWAPIPPPAAAGPFGGACFAPTLGGVFFARASSNSVWDGATWRLLAALDPNVPPGQPLVFDAGSGGVIACGRTTARFRPGSGWQSLWNGGGWFVAGRAAAYVSRLGLPVLYGVEFDNVPNTWWWDGASWQIATTVQPPRRANTAIAYDSRRDAIVMFGGEAGGSSFADTWQLRVSLAAARWTSYGTPCSGLGANAPRLAADERFSPTPIAGGLFFARIDDAPPRAPLYGLLGFSDSQWGGGALPFDLTAFGMDGCALLCSPEIVESAGVADASGTGSWIVPLPPGPGALGLRFFQQVAVLAPGANAAGVLWTGGGAGVVGVR